MLTELADRLKTRQPSTLLSISKSAKCNYAPMGSERITLGSSMFAIDVCFIVNHRQTVRKADLVCPPYVFCFIPRALLAFIASFTG